MKQQVPIGVGQAEMDGAAGGGCAFRQRFIIVLDGVRLAQPPSPQTDMKGATLMPAIMRSIWIGI